METNTGHMLNAGNGSMADRDEAEFDVPGLVLPNAPARWVQAGLLVLDGSGSMTDPVEGTNGFTKGQAVHAAVAGLVERLKESKNRANFRLGIVTFSDGVTSKIAPMKLDEFQPAGGSRNFDPTSAATPGGTNLGVALEAAADMADQGISQGKSEGLPTSCVVITMSDGRSRDADRVRRAAATLREKGIEVGSTMFATTGEELLGEPLLREIAWSKSGREMYRRTADIEELRKFFLDSITNTGGA